MTPGGDLQAARSLTTIGEHAMAEKKDLGPVNRALHQKYADQARAKANSVSNNSAENRQIKARNESMARQHQEIADTGKLK